MGGDVGLHVGVRFASPSPLPSHLVVVPLVLSPPNPGFPVMEVGIETGQIHKNKRKEKNLRNSHLEDEHAENSRCHVYVK